jgi:hypothetical protein
MNDIAEKDKTIFNLNKQLANMQTLLQAQEILSKGDDMTQSLITSSEIN